MTDTQTRPVIRSEFVIQRQGKSFVLYNGLLDLATERGLTRLETEVVTATATFALFKATATFSDGRVFTEHGDATPENVGRTIAPHFVRMAATRAKARALRDSLNISAVALEEMGDLDDGPTPIRTLPTPPPTRPAEPPAPRSTPPRPPATPPAPTGPAALLHHPDEVDTWVGDQLGDACVQMAERLAAAGLVAGPMPEPRTLRGGRTWYRTGYASLTARGPAQGAPPPQPALIPAAPPTPRSHYDEEAPSTQRSRTR